MKRILIILASIFPYILVFIASLYLPKDPDLGWHLKYGEYFFQHHTVLRENIYSTMMPGYLWTNGSWGTDVLTYTFYHWGGFLGLTIASALIVTATFFFFAKAARLSIIDKAISFPILLYLTIPLNSGSFRGQQISMLFIGVLAYILSRYKPFSKTLFFIPLLFLLWGNVHEESILGIGILGLWCGIITCRQLLFARQKKQQFTIKKEILFLLGIFLFSVLATCINPFGIGIYYVALAHIGDPLLKSVSEYIPFTPFSLLWWNQIFVGLALLLGLINIRTNKNLKLNFPFLILSLMLLIAAFNVRRYVWPAYYLALPFLQMFGKALEENFKKYTRAIAFIITIIAIIYTISLKSPFNQFTTMSWNIYCQVQSVPCSPHATQYLREHKLTHKLFTYYDWGGWLIWNYPDIRPSIDGRMHIWRDDSGYSAAEKYSDYVNDKKNINDAPFDVIYIPLDRSPLYQKLSDLVRQNKWKEVYNDDTAVILVRSAQSK